MERFGSDVFWWAGPIWILVLIPILDTLLGRDRTNPPDWAVPQLEASKWYRAEDYHQDYYRKNPIRYNYYRFACGRDARVEEVWSGK